MEETTSLFEVDPESGSVVYVIKEDEGEGNNDVGEPTVPSDQVGDLLESSEILPENDLEDEESTSESDFLGDYYTGDFMVLSEEASAAILAASPAGGSIGTSTLDYFDRVVSGLPSDYTYVAYRTSIDDSYDAILYYGRDYDLSDGSIVFSEAVQLEVDRVSTSGYQNETRYYSNIVSDVSVDFSQGGPIVYYTNASVGYPVLGGFMHDSGYAPMLTAVLIGAVAVVVLSKLLLKR